MSGFVLSGNRWSGVVADGVARPVDMVVTYDASAREVTRDGAVIGSDIFGVLGTLVAEDPTAVWVGYFGYACRTDLRARAAAGTPDAIWMRVEGATMVADQGVGWPALEEIPRRGQGALPSGRTTSRPASATTAPDTYTLAFAEVQRRLRAGDSYEVNLTRRVDLGAHDVDPAEAYANLCAINPAPYAAHLWHGGTHLLSASPESFVSIVDGRVRTRPIKGTTPRSDDPYEDAAQCDRLAADPRYRAENLMITDLMRNDLAQVCTPGSVTVPSLMRVESYAAVHQLVSTIEGDLAEGVRVVEAIRALFPAGSMTGAPKRRTMEIIDAVETSPRGIYSGALGWISGNSCELSVVIRSLIRDRAERWHAGTGGGITVHSDAASEWAESQWKLERLIESL